MSTEIVCSFCVMVNDLLLKKDKTITKDEMQAIRTHAWLAHHAVVRPQAEIMHE